MNKKLEKYQSDLGEKALKLFLEKFYKIKLRKIRVVKGKKTPDYKILDYQDNVIAVCEVKSLLDTSETLVSHEDFSYEKEIKLSQKRDKNHRAKLNKVHDEALSQLKDYSHLLKVVVFSSFDMTDYIDLDNVLQDHLAVFPEIPLADAYLIVKIHQSIIGSDTFTVKQSVQLRYSNQVGKDFLDKRFSLAEALEKGVLPVTFNL